MLRENEGFRHYFSRTGCVVTVHNAGLGYHQEVGDLAFAQAITGLPHRVIMGNLLDGSFDPLIASSSYALLNTVSENYARELRETYDDEGTGWLGHRLMARGVPLQGITNGIEPNDFDPSKPSELGLPAGFDPAAPSKDGLPGKRKCKEELILALQNKSVPGVRQDGTLSSSEKTPLFTFIGRLTAQKGVDKMIEALKNFLPIDPDFQILIQGTGEKSIEDELVRLALNKKYAGRICLLRGYDTLVANKIYAAGDFFLVPSRYEPCGLTDFIAQIFGNIPIVHHVGGLVKVLHGKTGFAYKEHSADALLACMREAVAVFRKSPKDIAAIQKKAMQVIHENFTWKKVMLKYLDLYQEAKNYSIQE
jgi:starch synthase